MTHLQRFRLPFNLALCEIHKDYSEQHYTSDCKTLLEVNIADHEVKRICLYIKMLNVKDGNYKHINLFTDLTVEEIYEMLQKKISIRICGGFMCKDFKSCRKNYMEIIAKHLAKHKVDDYENLIELLKNCSMISYLCDKKELKNSLDASMPVELF